MSLKSENFDKSYQLSMKKKSESMDTTPYENSEMKQNNADSCEEYEAMIQKLEGDVRNHISVEQ